MKEVVENVGVWKCMVIHVYHQWHKTQTTGELSAKLWKKDGTERQGLLVCFTVCE